MLFKTVLYRIKIFFQKRYLRFKGGKMFSRPAIRKAKQPHAETGLRYRVFFFKGKYHVYNRREIRNQMKDGFLKRVKLEENLGKVCFFDTDKM